MTEGNPVGGWPPPCPPQTAVIASPCDRYVQGGLAVPTVGSGVKVRHGRGGASRHFLVLCILASNFHPVTTLWSQSLATDPFADESYSFLVGLGCWSSPVLAG